MSNGDLGIGGEWDASRLENGPSAAGVKAHQDTLPRFHDRKSKTSKIVLIQTGLSGYSPHTSCMTWGLLGGIFNLDSAFVSGGFTFPANSRKYGKDSGGV